MADAGILTIIADATLRVKIHRALEESHVELREALTGQQGLQTLQREKAQVVVVEEVPGSLEPKELIQEIKKISPDQPILVLLRQHSLQKAMDLLNAGAYDCMEPNFGLVELLAVIRKGMVRTQSEPLELIAPSRGFWKSRWFWISLLLMLSLAGGAWMYKKSRDAGLKAKEQIQETVSEKVYTLPYTHPSGIAFDGENYWICDWFAQSLYRHKPNDIFELAAVYHFADINPVAIAWSGSVLWVISANGLIQKHALDEKLTVLKSVKSPGPSPSGIAFDGNYIWTSDSNLKKIFKHLPDDKMSVIAEYPYPGETPGGLFWDGNFLWSADPVRKAILRHRVDGNRLLIDELKQFSQYRDPEFRLVSATFDGKRFWSISENPPRAIRHPVTQ